MNAPSSPPSVEFLSGDNGSSLLVMPGTPEADIVSRAAILAASDEYDRAALITDPAKRHEAELQAKADTTDLRNTYEKLRIPKQKTPKTYNELEPVVITGEKLDKILGGLALVMGTGYDTTQRAKELWDKAQDNARKTRLERLKVTDQAVAAKSLYEEPTTYLDD